jgi:hypothetical protein
VEGNGIKPVSAKPCNTKVLFSNAHLKKAIGKAFWYREVFSPHPKRPLAEFACDFDRFQMHRISIFAVYSPPKVSFLMVINAAYPSSGL